MTSCTTDGMVSMELPTLEICQQLGTRTVLSGVHRLYIIFACVCIYNESQEQHVCEVHMDICVPHTHTHTLRSADYVHTSTNSLWTLSLCLHALLAPRLPQSPNRHACIRRRERSQFSSSLILLLLFCNTPPPPPVVRLLVLHYALNSTTAGPTKSAGRL